MKPVPGVPFSTLRRAYELLGCAPRPSVARMERTRPRLAVGMRQAWRECLEEALTEESR